MAKPSKNMFDSFTMVVTSTKMGSTPSLQAYAEGSNLSRMSFISSRAYRKVVYLMRDTIPKAQMTYN